MSIFASILSACATNKLPPIATVPKVDLPKFMGDWYVIAAIPTIIETQSYNAIENYKLNADGTIATTFTFNKGSLNGELKTYHPHGFVVENTGNALWGMQFIWPIKSEYRIAYLNEDYTQTVIARNARDYVWIMARTPTISDTEYTKLTSFISNLGYDLSKLRKVPHNASKVTHP
ncbi:MAG: lipocalin family protein [Methylotenera sp.]|uniref:lipocalin family protein n=1 Tax=Methylotenera sp. TaxID=2051956 RepID=UPI002487A9B8|nr:lipocalin family protein [Methylotenera sp.]MDI1309512.1 lipocalin family protein [Methylotenera sp.]